MNTSDFEQFCEIVKAAADAAGRPAPNKNGLTFLFGVLKRYDLEQVKGAYMAHFRSPEGRFWPTPAHIIEQIDGKPEDVAAAAWSLVERMLKQGPYRSVRFPAPAYHYAIEHLGGWIDLGDRYADCDTRDAMFLAREFKRFFLMAGRAGADWDNVPAYLPGIYENENSPRLAARKVLIVETGEAVPRETFSGRQEPHEELAAGLSELIAGKRL